MNNTLFIGKDINGTPAYDVQLSSFKYSVVLSAGVEKTMTIPSTAGRVFFSYGAGTTVWVAFGDTTVQMPGANIVATNSECNPQGRYNIKPGDTLRFKTNDTTAEVGIIFYD